jgi:hypothetical protein
MVGYPFDYHGNKISYAVGNPMGAYSSWASFAVAHHYVVYYCCRKTGVDWFNLPYCLLGDDIVIGDSIVGDEYLRVMSSIGVEVSELKTHKSHQLYEFAKRLFYRGNEISPFPISALKESSKQVYRLVSLLLTQNDRYWSFSEIPLAIQQLTASTRIRRKKYLSKIYDRAVMCEITLKMLSRSISAKEGCESLLRLDGLEHELSEDFCINVLKSVINDMFTQSDPTFDKGNGKPLGDLAISLTCHLTSFVDTDPAKAVIGFDCIQSLPHLQVYGQVEERYMQLKREEVNHLFKGD